MKRLVPLMVLSVLAGAGCASRGALRPPDEGPPAAVVPFDVIDATIPDLQAAMAAGRLTSRALVAIYRARIEAYDRSGPRLNAMISLNPRALAEAEALDRERATRGPRGPLHGIPIVLKDNFDMAGMPTTAGSIAFAGFYPAEEAFQVRKLRAAGAIILGKTNMHELASGITTISSLGGQTRNPYDLARNPGGSSGGTGAAVAASFAAAGMGSDTCGSIRIPAAHNNLVGLRASAGLASRQGILPLSLTQDVGGPLARTITDLAIMLDATVGFDEADPDTRHSNGRIPMSYLDALAADGLAGARIGVVEGLFGDAPDDEEVTTVVRRAIDRMREQGAEIVPVIVPNVEDLLKDSSVIDSEFKFDLIEYLARSPNPPVHSLAEILDRGLFHVALESSFRRRNAPEIRDTERYRAALRKRVAIRETIRDLLREQRLDALVYPTVRRKPALIGEPQRGSTCQLSASSGLPALTVPAGFTDDGLPVGLELLGEPFAETGLLRLGYAFEQATRHRRPPPTTPALVGGRAPVAVSFELAARFENAGPAPGAHSRRSPRAQARFTFDEARGELAYNVSVTGVARDDVLGAAVHRGGPGVPGPVVHLLVPGHATTGSGTWTLSALDRDALEQGELHLVVYTRDQPGGALRMQIGPLQAPGSRP